MEFLESVHMFTGSNKLDRDSCHMLDRKGCAPPRASPSSLVMMQPSSSSASLNPLALLTASCPVIPSTTRVHLIRLYLTVDRRKLSHQFLIDCQPPRCIENENIDLTAALLRPSPARQTATGSFNIALRKHRHANLFTEVRAVDRLPRAAADPPHKASVFSSGS